MSKTHSDARLVTINGKPYVYSLGGKWYVKVGKATQLQEEEALKAMLKCEVRRAWSLGTELDKAETEDPRGCLRIDGAAYCSGYRHDGKGGGTCGDAETYETCRDALGVGVTVLTPVSATIDMPSLASVQAMFREEHEAGKHNRYANCPLCAADSNDVLDVLERADKYLRSEADNAQHAQHKTVVTDAKDYQQGRQVAFASSAQYIANLRVSIRDGYPHLAEPVEEQPKA